MELRKESERLRENLDLLKEDILEVTQDEINEFEIAETTDLKK